MTIATNSPKESSEGVPNMSTDSSTLRRTRPNPDKLPDNHLIDWLPQAKERYKTELPPFVERNQGGNRAGLRKKVTLMGIDDQQQDLPVEAEIICWSWDSDWTFHTIDVGGQRLIIKGHPSAHYCHYKKWEGPTNGFSIQYIAYAPHQQDAEEPKLNLRTQLANKIRKISNAPYLESSDGLAQQTLTKSQYTPRPEWRPSGFSPINSPSSSSVRPAYSDFEHLSHQNNTQRQQHYVRKESMAQVAGPSVTDSPRPMETDSHDVQEIPPPVRRDSQHYTQAKNDRALSLGSRQGESSPKGRDYTPNSPRGSIRVTPSQRPSNEAPEIKKDNPLTSTVHQDKAVVTQRAHHTPTERTNEMSNSKQPHRNTADGPPPPAQRPQHQGHSPAEPNMLSKPTKRKRQASSANPASPQLSTSQSTRSSPQQQTTPSSSSQNPSRLSTPTTTNTTTTTATTSLTTPQPTTHHHQPPPSSSTSTSPSSSSTPLTPHKQSRTTLFIAIPLSTDTVPLKLRSCPSLPSFFASVLAISDPSSSSSGQQQQQQDPAAAVSGIRATFGWKGEGDVDRAILLRREVPDTWEVFLEIVDAAPCWGKEEGGGRCGVGVEVVLV